MKKYCAKILTMIVVLVLFLPMEVSAENGEGLKVDGSGQITLVSSYASEEDISSMSFSLYVKAAASDKVEFRFNESNGKIREFRYDKESGKLSVYIAGTEALMKDGAQSLNIGSVQVLNGNGGAAAASDRYADDFLYDMEQDPHQLNNVVTDPAYAQVKAELRERLLDWIWQAEGARPVITD